jgi:deoxyribose-phosphate aldolase
MNQQIQKITEILALAKTYHQELPPPPPALNPPLGKEIAGWIDHTLLRPDTTAAQIRSLCDEARQYNFAGVCVNSFYVPLAVELLRETRIAVFATIGFPLGAHPTTVKVFETLTCVNAGAEEIDMVMNIGALKGEAYGLVLNDIQTVAQAAHNQGAALKVILETGMLNRWEKICACLICKAAGVDFVKTSTGLGYGGATVEDVDLMSRVVGPEVKVKASGGIRSYADALAMIQTGASRIGTSAGVRIVEEALTSSTLEVLANPGA